MNISLILFLIGILGFILNRKNIILMIIAIEIMLLSVTLLVLIMSYGFDDNIGQTFSIYIISIAGAESVIGLSILVAYYRLFTPIISNCLFNNNTLHFLAPSTSLEGEKLQIKCNNISFYKQTRNYSTYLSPADLLHPLACLLQAHRAEAGTKVIFYIVILYLLLDCSMLRAPL